MRKIRPRDVNRLGKRMVEKAIVVSQTTDGAPDSSKSEAAVLLGRLGGMKGGPARAKKLSKKRRSEIARKAAEVRWQLKEQRSGKETSAKKPERSKAAT